MQEKPKTVNDETHAGNRRSAGDDEYHVKFARAMRRALRRAANYVMRHGDPAAAANEALVALRAEFLWRFELLRSRHRQPVLIVPAPLPPSPGSQPTN